MIWRFFGVKFSLNDLMKNLRREKFRLERGTLKSTKNLVNIQLGGEKSKVTKPQKVLGLVIA